MKQPNVTIKILLVITGITLLATVIVPTTLRYHREIGHGFGDEGEGFTLTKDEPAYNLTGQVKQDQPVLFRYDHRFRTRFSLMMLIPSPDVYVLIRQGNKIPTPTEYNEKLDAEYRSREFLTCAKESIYIQVNSNSGTSSYAIGAGVVSSDTDWLYCQAFFESIISGSILSLCTVILSVASCIACCLVPKREGSTQDQSTLLG